MACATTNTDRMVPLDCWSEVAESQEIGKLYMYRHIKYIITYACGVSSRYTINIYASCIHVRMHTCTHIHNCINLSYYNSGNLCRQLLLSVFLSVLLSVPKFCFEIRFPRKPFARFGSNSTNVLPQNLRCAF